jgi:hypothetical protein
MADKVKPDNEGEGSKSAARRYNDRAEEHVRSGKSDDAAEQAREDVDGPDGEELRKAEAEGKRHIAEEDPEVEARDNDDVGAVRGDD